MGGQRSDHRGSRQVRPPAPRGQCQDGTERLPLYGEDHLLDGHAHSQRVRVSGPQELQKVKSILF